MKIISTPCGMLMANMHLIYSDNRQAIVIDPIDCDILLRLLQENDLELCGILLTHAHFDHIVDLDKIRKKTSAPSYIVSSDIPLLSDPNKNVSAWLSCPTTYPPCDHLLAHGDVVNIADFSIKVFHTPGHTPGSACYLIDDVLFTGDTVMSGGIGRCDLYGGDFNQMRSSLQFLLTQPPTWRIYPGHGNNTTLSAIHSMIRYYIK